MDAREIAASRLRKAGRDLDLAWAKIGFIELDDDWEAAKEVLAPLQKELHEAREAFQRIAG